MVEGIGTNNDLLRPMASHMGLTMSSFYCVLKYKNLPGGIKQPRRLHVGIFRGILFMITPEGLDYERSLLTIWGFLLVRMPQGEKKSRLNY